MSTIKNTYESVEDIPAGLESHYTQSDNGYTFNGVDGYVDKGRLNEFRDNNIQLRKDLESRDDQIGKYSDQLTEMMSAVELMESKYGNVDLEEWSSYQAERKQIAEKELIDAGDVNQLIEQRVQEVLTAKAKESAAQKSAYETQIQGLQENITGYDSQLNKMLVDNELTKIAADKGVRASALEDVLFRGRNVFRVEDGQATAFTNEGRQMYMEDAVTPLSIDGWLEGLTGSAPHLFEMSSGAGASQPTSSPASAAEPMTTEQMILQGLGNLR